MSDKSLICLYFWKLFSVGIEFYVDRVFTFSTFKKFSYTVFLPLLFPGENSVILAFGPLCITCIISLRTLKLCLHHWLLVIWLWCTVVSFYSCFLDWVSLSFLDLWFYSCHSPWKNFGHCFPPPVHGLQLPRYLTA